MGIAGGKKMLDGEADVEEAVFTTKRPKHLKDSLLSNGNGSVSKNSSSDYVTKLYA